MGVPGLLEAIDKAILNTEGKLGRADLTAFKAAAPYLLQHFEIVYGEVTVSVTEDFDSHESNLRETDIVTIDEEGGERIVRCSQAIIFLLREFQKLTNDGEIKPSLAVTVIEDWKKKYR